MKRVKANKAKKKLLEKLMMENQEIKAIIINQRRRKINFRNKMIKKDRVAKL